MPKKDQITQHIKSKIIKNKKTKHATQLFYLRLRISAYLVRLKAPANAIRTLKAYVCLEIRVAILINVRSIDLTITRNTKGQYPHDN